jgi:general secretion pathway protein D
MHSHRSQDKAYFCTFTQSPGSFHFKHALRFALVILLAGCTSMSAEIEQAEQFGARGDWDSAVTVYRQLMKQAPTDAELMLRYDAARAQAADLHFVAGQRALQDRQIDDAILEYKLAMGYNPASREYHTSLTDALRLKEAREQIQAGHKLRQAGRYEEALAAYEHALTIDPNLTEGLEAIGKLTAQARASKGFGGSNQPITLRFQNVKLKEVFEILTKTSGLSVLFDKEVKDDPITMFIKDMPADDALNLILNTNGLVAHKIGSDTLLVIPNTKQKLAQYQDLMIRTFYLSNAKAKEAVNLIRTLFESKRVYVDEKINAIVMREEPAKIQLAERVLQTIDRKDPEVQLDVEVLEVDRTKSLKYGVNFAKNLAAGIFPDATKGSFSTAATLFTFEQLTNLGPGSYLFSIPGSILLDFFKNETDAKTLASPKLRVLNNKQASINVGDKQPILLSTTNVLPGQAATGAVPTTSTVTSIEFKDTGVKLTVEPVINLTNELALKLKIEVTRLGDQVTLQASPEIKQFRFGTRTAETVLMVRDDETIVIGGLIQDDVRKTRNTVPWLGDLPGIGKLFSTWTEDVVTTEVVLTITPHIVRSLTGPVPDNHAFWSGTETNYSTSPLFSPQAMPVSMPLAGKEDKAAAAAPQVSTPPASSHGPPMTALSPGGQTGQTPSAQSVIPPPRTPAPPGPQTGSAPIPPAAPPHGPQMGSTPATPPSAQAGLAAPPSVKPPGPTPAPPPSDVAALAKPQTTVPAAPPTLSLRPVELTGTVGAEVVSEVVMDGFPGGVTDSSITVGFNPSVLELARTLEGDLISAGMGGSGLTVAAGAVPGTVTLNFRQGASGAERGVIARLTFKAKAVGTSPITVQSASI